MIAPGKIAAILLAAGRSERFGAEDKLLASLNGAPLFTHAARRIGELGPGTRIAVCGSLDGEPASTLGRMGFSLVLNPEPERGLSSSLALGIGQAEAAGTEAALVCLADMPAIGLHHLQALLATFDPVTAPIVASTHDGIAQPPALFDRTIFERLCGLEGDRGARTLLSSARLVTTPAGELRDVDRPQDMA